ncbi:MAG: DUF3369 domain-containing protein [Halopseudomonas aestusnigri]
MTDFLIDAPEDNETFDQGIEGAWKILIVDDEPAMHHVTHMALSKVVFEGRKLEFLSAYSGEEAKDILLEQKDIAIVLLDVVMKTDTEGLSVVKWIREELKNTMVRIILRTGQPGQAPEKKVILDFDINDYKEKSEMTTQKLFSCIISGLRSYRDLSALSQNREGLKRVIEASSHIFKERYLGEFISGALQQLTSLLYLESDAVLMTANSLAALETENSTKIIAGIGEFDQLIGDHPSKVVPQWIIDDWLSGSQRDNILIGEDEIVVTFETDDNHKNLLYLHSSRPISADAIKLIDLFTQNISIAHKNLKLGQEIEDTQNEIVSMLCGAVETRSKETANHIIRVAKISELIAKKYGLSTDEVNTLKLASPLHDIGKVGIPDNVLNKPGKHTPEEWEIMKSHAELGANILEGSRREIIQSGVIIARQHHEKWDGTGYPNQLSGRDIHIFGRISAVADVFDALCSKRCYKEAWTVEKTMELIGSESGKHFDPAIVDILQENLEAVIEIRNKYAD